MISAGKQKVVEKGAKLVAMANDKDSPLGKGKEAIVKGGKGVVTAAVKGALK